MLSADSPVGFFRISLLVSKSDLSSAFGQDLSKPVRRPTL